MDFADDFPDCQVTGIDLSPGQPTLYVPSLLLSLKKYTGKLIRETRVPPNVKFVIDDAEDMWLYQEKFDFIHVRLMSGCFSDWANFLRQAYE